MIKANTSFTFHNIGQGLFYSGIIKFNYHQFIFVYDCGGPNIKKIEFEIKRFKQRVNKSNIDMVILSHFHEDHINGVNYLLDKFNVKKVFLPYVSDIERLIIAIQTTDAEDNYYSFLADPYSYLINRGVEEIIVISGGESDWGDIEKPLPYKPENESDIKKIKIDFSKLKSDSQKNNDSNSNSFGNNWKNKIHFKKHNGFVHLSGLWLFKFYVNELSKEKKIGFEECIKDLLGKHDINKIILKKSLRDKLKECYKKIFGKNKFNNTSMMMMHIPINHKDISHFKLFPSLLFDNSIFFLYNLFLLEECVPFCFDELLYCIERITKKYHKFYPLKLFPKDIFGHSLTGDINLNFNYDKIVQHFNFFREQIIVNQLPHHGANKNWNNEFLSNFLSFFNIASAGNINNHGHPSKSVFEEIFERGRIPLHVNEDIWFTIKSKVVW